MVLGLAALGVAARRGWAQAGLVSIGLASIMGLAVCFSAGSGPVHQYDVALLTAPMALCPAMLSYVYVRWPGEARLGAVAGVWSLNAVAVYVTSRSWQDWQSAHGKPALAVPLLVFLTGVLLAGPLLAWLGEIARRLPRRA